MNERIRQLAEQAGFKTNWQHEDVQAIKMARFEKFAQLIVAECIDVVSDCSVEYCTRPQIVSEIREHFGVEE